MNSEKIARELLVAAELLAADPFDRHSKNIAIKTLKMPDEMLGVMGGMTKDEARKVLLRMGWSKSRIHRLEASDKRQAAESVFDADDAPRLIQAIEGGVDAPYVKANVSTLGGPANATLMFSLSLEPKSDWVNGIFQNSPCGHWSYSRNGVLEQFQAGFKMPKKFRKTRARNVAEVVRKVNAYLDKCRGLLKKRTAAFSNSHLTVLSREGSRWYPEGTYSFRTFESAAKAAREYLDNEYAVAIWSGDSLLGYGGLTKGEAARWGTGTINRLTDTEDARRIRASRVAADTFPCPECGTKVLKQTGYCVKCKKKVKEAASTRQKVARRAVELPTDHFAVRAVGYDGREWFWVSEENGLRNVYTRESDFARSLKNEMGNSQEAYRLISELEEAFEGRTASRTAASLSRLSAKKKLRLRSGDEIPAGMPVEVVEFSRDYPYSVTFESENGVQFRLLPRNGSKFLKGFPKAPGMRALERMADRGVAKAVDGSRVEPDGFSPNGAPSWLLVLGFI